MTWDEIAELQASGRWDIEAHTQLEHIRVPAGPNGEQGPVPDYAGLATRAEPGGDAG